MARYVFAVKQGRQEDARQWLAERNLDSYHRIHEGTNVIRAVVYDSVVVPEELGPEFKLAFSEDIGYNLFQDRD